LFHLYTMFHVLSNQPSATLCQCIKRIFLVDDQVRHQVKMETINNALRMSIHH
jgi:hypothetical protein